MIANIFRSLHILLVSCVVSSGCLVMLAGCGQGSGVPTLHQVNGTLTINGKPAPDLNVVMHVEGNRPSSGLTDANGKFTMYYTSTQTGVVAGENYITLSPANGDTELFPIPEEFKEVVERYGEGTKAFKMDIDKDYENFELNLQ